MAHPERDNVWDEARVCKKLNQDKPEIIDRQMERYKNGGWDGKGMVASTMLIRRNTPENSKVNEMWWKEVETESRRDQLSFNYVTWKLNFKYETFPFLENCHYSSHL